MVKYSKIPYPLRNHIIPNEASIRAQEPQSSRPSGSWTFGGCWVGNYAISQRVWIHAFIPWPVGMRIAGCWEITHFRTPLFFTDF